MCYVCINVNICIDCTFLVVASHLDVILKALNTTFLVTLNILMLFSVNNFICMLKLLTPFMLCFADAAPGSKTIHES